MHVAATTGCMRTHIRRYLYALHSSHALFYDGLCDRDTCLPVCLLFLSVAPNETTVHRDSLFRLHSLDAACVHVPPVSG